MRKLTKLERPNVLAENWLTWTRDCKNHPNSEHRKNKYRHKDIKDQLLLETSHKCVYCESKIGDTLPGDIEHMIPKSVRPAGRFVWSNLTISCTECNRRKGVYLRTDVMFLNPYRDDVESLVVHLGPIAAWKPGDIQAEVTVKMLELHNNNRWELISQKIEHLEHLNDAVHRQNSSTGVEREIAKMKIDDMCMPTEKYSAMVNSVLGNVLSKSTGDGQSVEA